MGTFADVSPDAKTEAGGDSSSSTAYATGAVQVMAGSSNTAFARSDGASGGLVGGNDQLPQARVEGDTRAVYLGHVTNATGYSATATSGNNSVAKAELITIGAIAIAFGEATAKVTSNATTDAGIGSASVGSGAVMLMATSADQATSDAGGGTGGGVTITLLKPDAETYGGTSAFVAAGGVVNAGSVTANASATPTAKAHAHIISISAINGSGATPTAIAGGTTEVYVGDHAHLHLGSGAASFTATHNATATTDNTDVSLSLIGVSVVDLEATTNGTVKAHVDDRATIDAGSLDLEAHGTGTPTVSSNVVGLKLIGGAGISTKATDTTTALA
jgi:hypothetical protein